MPSSTQVLAQLDLLARDDPYGQAFEHARVVAGDLLQAIGDPRGELIALERAVELADGRAKRDKQRELFERLVALEPELGELIRCCLTTPAGCELRGGRLVGLQLDVRPNRLGHRLWVGTLLELMVELLKSPLGRELRALHVRVRQQRQLHGVFDLLRRAADGLPLERLCISLTTRPLGHQPDPHTSDLCRDFPHLWFTAPLAHVTPLLDPDLPDRGSAEALLERRGQPLDRELRVHIGRGLSSGRERTTRAACELLCELGPSGAVFLPALDLLLRPRVSHAAPWILATLHRFGPWARALLPRLHQMNGDARRYPDEVRRLAGHCATSLVARASDPPT